MHVVCANIFGANVLKSRFKIDVVIMFICSIVIIINSVLTLQVLTAKYPMIADLGPSPCRTTYVFHISFMNISSVAKEYRSSPYCKIFIM
jgi:hypothetical protein